MADIADRAADHIERESAGLLAKRKPVGPAACGACHFCGEEVRGEARFCDADCRDGYEREQRAVTQRVAS